MSRRSKISADITDLDAMLKRLGAANPEVSNILAPKSFEIMMHPFTAMISKELPGFKQLLSNIFVNEMVRNVSKMDADEKLIDLGLVASGKEAEEKERDKK